MNIVNLKDSLYKKYIEDVETQIRSLEGKTVNARVCWYTDKDRFTDELILAVDKIENIWGGDVEFASGGQHYFFLNNWDIEILD